MGYTLRDNRRGLTASPLIITADGYAEREAAKVMIHDAVQVKGDADIEITLGADKAHNAKQLIEQGHGWAKAVGTIRKVMVRRVERVDQIFALTIAASNLTRMRTLGQIRRQAM